MTLPRLLLLVLLVLACTALGIGVVAVSERPAPPAPLPARATSPAVTGGAVAVLRDWDRRRARAWTAGDAAALRALYAPRSTAGRRDVARLRQWLDRRQRVRRLETQLLRVRVVDETSGRLVLAVTDRVARAVTTGGVRLPDDAPSTWRITLRRVQGEWRVAAVRR